MEILLHVNLINIKIAIISEQTDVIFFNVGMHAKITIMYTVEMKLKEKFVGGFIYVM